MLKYDSLDFPWFIPIGIIGAFSGVAFLVNIAFLNRQAMFCMLTFLTCLLLIYFLYHRQKPTKNIVFENHQTEVVENLKKEREAFIKFLEQEREAEDSAAFAKFMKREK